MNRLQNGSLQFKCGMFDVNNHITQRHASRTQRRCFMGDDIEEDVELYKLATEFIGIP